MTAEQRRETSAVVRLRDVHFSLSRRVFSGVDVDIGRGSVTAIMGPSGAGKTTLLRLITGQLRADAGRVIVEGRDVASLHNSQPWLFRINVMDVEVFADRRRALRVVDPHDRELTMSCGAAVFNLRVAAEYFGHHNWVDLQPDAGPTDLLARFHLGMASETSSEDILMFQAITQRRTNRQPFADTPLPDELLARLKEAARQEGAWLQIIDGDDSRNAVADLVAEADRQQWSSRSFCDELSRWVRTRPDEARDGLILQAIGVKDWMAFVGPLLIRTFDRGGGQAAKDRL